jgi:hypothetical protein
MARPAIAPPTPLATSAPMTTATTSSIPVYSAVV